MSAAQTPSKYFKTVMYGLTLGDFNWSTPGSPPALLYAIDEHCVNVRLVGFKHHFSGPPIETNKK